MDRSILMLLVGLIFGGGLGFTVAAANGITLDGHDHATDHGHATAAVASHDHETPRDLPAGPDAPTLAVTATPDPSSGWNLHLETGNFVFSPEHASTDHVPGEGHAHVYIDGVKLGRFYGPWLHLPAQEPGTKVRVTLNPNDHRPLAVGGDRVEETLLLD